MNDPFNSSDCNDTLFQPWKKTGFRLWRAAVLAALLATTCAKAQTFSTVYNFADYTVGDGPNGTLAAYGSVLYGTTIGGGSYEDGSLFSMNDDGSDVTVLHSFSGSDGETVYDGPVVSGDGTALYGVTYLGGSGGYGTVYAVNTDGTGFATLHNFGSDDGQYPHGTLVLDGTALYGTTINGGSGGYGTIYSIQTDGTGYTTLYNFTSSAPYPASGLILSGSTLYGTTTAETGVVYSIQTDGSGFTILYNFGSGNGSDAALLLSGNVLYGTTLFGGDYSEGSVFSVNTDGTGYTTLYSFTGTTDGSFPDSPLILYGDRLYGVAEGYIDPIEGCVYSIVTNGDSFVNLYTDATCGDSPGWGGWWRQMATFMG